MVSFAISCMSFHLSPPYMWKCDAVLLGTGGMELRVCQFHCVKIDAGGFNGLILATHFNCNFKLCNAVMMFV